MIWINISIGIFLVVLIILLHGFVTRYIISLVNRRYDQNNLHFKRSNEIWISVIVLVFFLISIIESVVWASVYILVDAIESIEEALYFSLVTYTTLGYGDLVLSEDWRLLAALEAVTGIIIFGWSTAIVLAVVQKLYFKK